MQNNTHQVYKCNVPLLVVLGVVNTKIHRLNIMCQVACSSMLLLLCEELLKAELLQNKGDTASALTMRVRVHVLSCLVFGLAWHTALVELAQFFDILSNWQDALLDAAAKEELSRAKRDVKEAEMEAEREAEGCEEGEGEEEALLEQDEEVEGAP